MARTVITVPGFGSSIYQSGNFQGTFLTAPNVWIDRPSGGWSNWISNASGIEDRDDLYDLIIEHINDLPDGVIVAGHSRGAQMIQKLFRERKADLDANVDPSRILFICSGCPERNYNGSGVMDPVTHNSIYPGDGGFLVGYGLPDPYPFTVLDISRQYDEFADHPADLANTVAHQVTQDASVHIAYSACGELGKDGWPTNWDDWAYYQEGNIHFFTWRYWPYPDLPAQPPYTFLANVFKNVKQEQDGQYGYTDFKMRQAVESAFRRPYPVLPPPQFRWELPRVIVGMRVLRLRGGVPDVVRTVDPPPNITFVSGASYQASSGTVPTHQSGDLIIVAAARDGDVTPSLGSGFTSVYNGTMFRVGYKIAASSAESSGTWSNANGISIAVYRKPSGNAWAGLTTTNAAASNATINYAEFVNSTSCLFVRCAGHRGATNLLSNTPAGWTVRSTENRYSLIMDSGMVSINANSVGGNSQLTNNTDWWRSVTLQILLT